jgi:multidrug transporter EmrE-like cation transporter
MAWLFLLVAGAFEIGFTTCLRFADGFKNAPWTAGFFICASLSFVFLDLATRNGLPLGTAYAVWTGIGAMGTVLLGMMFFAEPASAVRIGLIVGLIACVAGLKATSGH